MNIPATASFKEFARILGVKSRSYVSELKRDGRLVLTEDGRGVLVAESLQRIKDSRDPSKAGVAARHEATRGEGPTGGAESRHAGTRAPTVADPSQDKVGGTYQAARAVRERYLAMEAKRAYEQAVGKLMDATEVEAAVASAITELRTRLEALPWKLAPELAVTASESEVVALLAAEIESALDEISRQFLTLAKKTPP